MSISLRDILTWKPKRNVSNWGIVFLVILTLVGLALALAGSFYFENATTSMVSTVSGGIICAAFSFLSYRVIRTKIATNWILDLLRDGQATYLMPGAFTHVLVHPDLPGKVILVKRGEKALIRFVGKLGPRRTSQDERNVYQRLAASDLAAETEWIADMPVSEISIALGGNLQVAAVKGEERFVADAEIDEEVEVLIQERGIPLNHFLAKNPKERNDVFRAFGRLIHRVWKSGLIDLDVAFRNCMLAIDEDGEPQKDDKGYVVLVHDFGCIFSLPESVDEIENYLDQHGEVGNQGPASISNGAFLLKSLSGRMEVEFAPFLIKGADWTSLRAIFHDSGNANSLPKRLKHHSNFKVIRGAHRALVQSISRIAVRPQTDS